MTTINLDQRVLNEDETSEYFGRAVPIYVKQE